MADTATVRPGRTRRNAPKGSQIGTTQQIVRLTPERKARLDYLAALFHVGQAEVIRRLIDNGYNDLAGKLGMEKIGVGMVEAGETKDS